MEQLKLENQLCFPLYVASKEIIRQYRPFLEEFDITYTQYITLLILFEHEEIKVKDLGKIIYLDSGTLTPLLKKLESKGYIRRIKGENDERELYISLTDEGKSLENRLKNVPEKLSCKINLTQSEGLEMYKLLYKIIEGLQNE